LVIAHLAIEVYVNDIKTLVTSGVDKWIKDSKDDDDIFPQTLNRVKKGLTLWKQKSHPFDYAHYLLLCEIVKPDGVTLPPSSTPQLTLRTFLGSLIDLGLRQAKGGPPFVKGGSFQHILPVAVNKIKIHAISLGVEPVPYMAEILERVWILFRIHNIPWTAPSDPHRRGRHSGLVVYNAWSHFGGQRAPEQLLRGPKPHQQHAAALEQSLKLALRNDADAPWSTGDITIQDIHTILHRHMLPEDFVIPVMGLDERSGYIGETYRYVRDNFALPDPLHQLALIIGIIFSKLTPNVFMEKPAQSVAFHQLSTEESTREYLNTFGWETRPKKGLTQKNIFVSMTATYIIALYDADSPLRKYFATHQNLGRFWNDKHSK